MSVFVPRTFCCHPSVKGSLQIGTRLIGEAEGHEEDIREFFAQVFGLIALFFGLFPVAACNDSSYFSDFLRELRHIGQLIEVPNAKILNPLIYFGLQ